MTEFKQILDNRSFSDEISTHVSGFKLSWAEKIAGFDIFDLKDLGNRTTAIGDDADYLHLFMAMSDAVLDSSSTFHPLLIASDTGGKRIFVRPFTPAEKKEFKYAYIALGNAVKQLPESALNGKLSFFGEITLEDASKEGFAKEARKAARAMDGKTRQAWESLIEDKNRFLKTDLYVFHLLKLYSWGFQIAGQDKTSSSAFHFIRGQRPVTRGTNRH